MAGKGGQVNAMTMAPSSGLPMKVGQHQMYVVEAHASIRHPLTPFPHPLLCACNAIVYLRSSSYASFVLPYGIGTPPSPTVLLTK